ncbi:SNF1-related protein kinase regulatory subunit gamma-1-like [Andrographis paniculata]|uniref:SNF1-related protein kinase regulatory subunit gamma-1-like n=1 Tax=Andrographis paniculata TaxID=175694 RepID=UPI0021E73253|nr:SNF1-related protein kinase regulatory subunit gamma-1-like [Andrographis paniculata]
MASIQGGPRTSDDLQSNDAYFQMVQSKKKLPRSLQESLTGSFARIPVSSFPHVPGGKVIEIPADTLIVDAVKILSDSNILSAPVTNPAFADDTDWKKRYLGILDYSAIILWVLANTECAAADVLSQEPCKSTTVMSILKTYRWAPFVPVSPDSSMLSVMLLLSKYRLRNVPLIEQGNGSIQNYITQSAVVTGLHRCKGRDWFDYISACHLSDLGLPFMSPDQLVTVQDSDLILEAFKQMKDKQIGGLPVIESGTKKIQSSISVRDVQYLLYNTELSPKFRELTVKDFISSIGSDKLKTCKPDSTLGDVIEALASMAVHRIYVVGDDEVLVGVITLRDVISCFINEPAKFFENFFGFGGQEGLNR